MKAGLAISLTLHGALLGFGLFSLSGPRAFEVADVEALPVDIVPVSSLTQIQQGEKEAPAESKPAPKPTQRFDPVEEARNVGEADRDMETPITPDADTKPVARTAEPPPAPEPAPKPAEPEPVEPEPEPEPSPAPAEPAPAAEVEPEPQPPQDVTPEPAEEPMVAEVEEPERVALPQSAPVPQTRPQPPKAQAQRKTEDKDEELFDDVAALLNKEKASGGGAKRSNEQAALGGERTTAGETLTQSEMDALRGQIQRCWNVPAGALDAQNLRVSLKFRLDPSGAVEGNPQVIEGGGGSGVQRAAAQSARRAILQCAPYELPAEKYDAWADVIVHFDPTDMF